ncbi:uncharacterized protein LOC128547392 [Mercenaria mercenaria]|uniref:uncharacterized protein LOC128547392 n=1 Tax=Mercenaria mercenaria TaxID=6596 RepID=UPI00234FB4B1|nr:uncharacterized protein LOC128547392 [Mercenaria mercenaria]
MPKLQKAFEGPYLVKKKQSDLSFASGSKGKAAYRGRQYQCRRCLKVDRRGRTVAHILKHHVPFDQMPYSCSLCSFRCFDKDTLVNHISQYRRHKEEVAKAGGKVDHSRVLNRSSNPKYVGDEDMILLTHEDHGRKCTRQEDPLDDRDSIFEEGEDDFDALSLPDWAKGSPLEMPYQAPSLSMPAAPANSTIQFPVYNGLQQVLTSAPPRTTSLMTMPAAAVSSVPSFQLPVYGGPQQVLTTPPKTPPRSPCQLLLGVATLAVISQCLVGPNRC